MMQQITDMNEMEQIYRDCKPVVFSYLHTVCEDDLLVEDVTQETFFQILSQCCTSSGFIGNRFFRRREPLEKQICRLAYQLLQQAVLQKEKEQPVESALELHTELPALEYLPESSVLYREELQEVKEKLCHLREPVREVMMLRYYQKMSYREIAEYLRQSENWVKHMLRCGKMQIEQYLRCDCNML